jgi:urea transport system ATP-binding protein
MLELSGINQYYGGSHILRDVDLHCAIGQTTVLLGRNGVGKTTLLRCLMGVLPIKSGSIKFMGEDITRLPPHKRAAMGLGYVPQGREIFPRLTVAENLEMGLGHLKGAAASKVPEELFELFPILKQFLKRRGGDLSGGQQQQLAIARALAGRPKLIILDEPTEGIQPSIIKDIERVLRMLAGRGDMGVLLTEQYYDFAKSLADEYTVLQRGQVVKSGLGANMEADGVRSYLSV